MILASAFQQKTTVSDPCFTAIEDQSENLFLRQEMVVKLLALSALSNHTSTYSVGTLSQRLPGT